MTRIWPWVSGFTSHLPPSSLAEELYDQGRFDETARMIEEPLDAASPFYAARAALIKAKLLARRGQFAAAPLLADEGARLTPRLGHRWPRPWSMRPAPR